MATVSGPSGVSTVTGKCTSIMADRLSASAQAGDAAGGRPRGTITSMTEKTKPFGQLLAEAYKRDPEGVRKIIGEACRALAAAYRAMVQAAVDFLKLAAQAWAEIRQRQATYVGPRLVRPVAQPVMRPVVWGSGSVTAGRIPDGYWQAGAARLRADMMWQERGRR